MVYLSTIENSVARRYLSYEDQASAKKKLHRRFVKMIENCGGSIEHLKEGKPPPYSAGFMPQPCGCVADDYFR